MRRINEAGIARDLPEIPPAEHGDSDERLFLRVMLALVETGDMVHGKFIEVHVGSVLGADIPETGVSEWDLLVPTTSPIPVEVKCAEDLVGRTFRVRPKAGVDVWVFVLHAGKKDRTSPLQYRVLSSEQVVQLGKSTISARKLLRMGPLVLEADLRDAVIAASSAVGGR